MADVDLLTLQLIAVRSFVVVAMLSIGLQVDKAAFAALRRRWWYFLRALGMNFVLVPVIGLGAALALGVPEAVAVGVICTACAAGPSVGPKLVEIARGDLAEGAALVLLLSAVSALTVGPTASLLVGAYGSVTGSSITLDPIPIIVGLVFLQLLPLAIVVTLGQRYPSVAARVRPIMIRVATILLVATLAFLAIENLDELFVVGPWAIAAVTIVVAVAQVGGYLLGGPAASSRRGLAVVSGQRSAGVAIIAVQSAGLAPAVVTVIAYGLSMLVVNVGVAVTMGRRALKTSSAADETWASRTEAAPGAP
jgi:BASS family bile acid:Na+ symporter